MPAARQMPHTDAVPGRAAPPSRPAQQPAGAGLLGAAVPAGGLVVLHDHLDGGVRPGTLLDLAAKHRYRPFERAGVADVADQVAAATSGVSLERYLGLFTHTTAVLQHAGSLRRVACEAVQDLAADGVVAAELRFAPELHTCEGMSPHDAVEAVLAGVCDGAGAVRSSGGEVRVSVIVSALRNTGRCVAAARVAADFVGAGVVGFDLAGPEVGFSVSRHRDAFEVAASAGLGLTVHAGEAAGPGEVGSALLAGVSRVGHGVAVAAEVMVRGGEVVDLGPTALAVLDAGVVLEVCPSSNVHTGVVGAV